MAELPSGTITLLFSDIEGSTALLTRLGAAYGDALVGQRHVLRAAWGAHGGTEMGTEGDSFFVVFPTAFAAVAAAAQAQRDLVTYPWPRGEQVRVRMGMHTGSPTVLDGGYVGIDVHRAARVASAAHGGQVLLTSATAEQLGERPSAGLGLRRLGPHRLKDLATAVHLFQLDIEGLQTDFPPPKSLGAASRLPVPATPLFGRDGEIAELVALVRSGVRVTTLTGPGGTGKTRLSIGVAQRLVPDFPDGIYFVGLAAITSADLMWTSIAEVLDLPPDARNPDGLLADVEHRRALFVLDNLEQLLEADVVVARLLSAAANVSVLATSRRPLHVTGEFEHPVPGLEVPSGAGVGPVGRWGAIQMYVEHAKMVQPGFALTDDNGPAVVELCRRLDGMPLAIELVAARSKLLSPRALVARMDGVLDLAARSNQVASRHRTLRDTIAWSYDLLSADERSLLRQLGVFVGGASVEAIVAVATPRRRTETWDPLDLVAALVDASLLTVTETADGEPRLSLPETIRMFARDQLAAAGELGTVLEHHARFFTALAEEQGALLRGNRFSEARERLGVEHDNLRAALSWCTETDADPDALQPPVVIGLRLCAALDPFWRANSYYQEGQGWLAKAVERTDGHDSPELARCLGQLAGFLVLLGDPEAAQQRATEGVSMCRRLGDHGAGLSSSLRALAVAEEYRGRPEAARPAYDEALHAARASGDDVLIHRTLGYYATFEGIEHHDARSLALGDEAVDIARRLGDPVAEVVYQHSMACTLRAIGRVDEADQEMRRIIARAVTICEPAELAVLAEDYAAVKAELGDHDRAIRLLGAADAMREQLSTPRPGWQHEEIAEAIEISRTAMTTEQWDTAYGSGRVTAIEVALTAALVVEVRS